MVTSLRYMYYVLQCARRGILQLLLLARRSSMKLIVGPEEGLHQGICKHFAWRLCSCGPVMLILCTQLSIYQVCYCKDQRMCAKQVLADHTRNESKLIHAFLLGLCPQSLVHNL